MGSVAFFFTTGENTHISFCSVIPLPAVSEGNTSKDIPLSSTMEGFEGYLHKRGRGKNISIYKPYARRYFVLNPDTHELSYYADISRKSYRGVVNILNTAITEQSKATTGKSFCFDLKCNAGLPHEETVTLAAPNDTQLMQWITKIQEIGGGTVTWVPGRVLPEGMCCNLFCFGPAHTHSYIHTPLHRCRNQTEERRSRQTK